MQCIIYASFVLCNAPVLDPSTRVAIAFEPQRAEVLYTQETLAHKRYSARKQASTSAVQLNAVPRATQALAMKKRVENSASKTRVFSYAPVAEKPEKKGFLAAIFKPGTRATVKQRGLSPGYSAVYAASVKHGVDPDFMLKVAKIENGGKCQGTSRAGAQGVLQVMPSTAKMHGVKKASTLNSCKVGAEAGVKEMKRLLAMTGGNKRQAAIGYNCGPACIKRKKLPRETVNYVKKLGL